MWTFKRKKQPPPTPSPKVPVWIIQLLTPIMMAIVLGMVAFIGNGFSEGIKDVNKKVEQVDKEKVDNATLQLMIEKQELLIQHREEEAKREREENAKKFDRIQQTQSKTLDRIERIQTKQAPSSPPPSSEAPCNSLSEEQRDQRYLSPDEFATYISLSPDVREKYKMYLKSKGKDVSALP